MLWLIEPLSFAFMRHAIAIGFFFGILSALVVMVINKRAAKRISSRSLIKVDAAMTLALTSFIAKN